MDLEPIRRRLSAASCRPWKWASSAFPPPRAMDRLTCEETNILYHQAAWAIKPGDRAFIVHAGDDVQALLEVVDAQRELLERWLRLFRDPDDSGIHALERATAEAVGEFDGQPRGD